MKSACEPIESRCQQKSLIKATRKTLQFIESVIQEEQEEKEQKKNNPSIVVIGFYNYLNKQNQETRKTSHNPEDVHFLRGSALSCVQGTEKASYIFNDRLALDNKKNNHYCPMCHYKY